ncbi:VOC family protein [Mucilaginibacter sp. OK098]|uniref:VOC family protein n=1 Tax=Mucilaginibacter sp. OK098 TaxID=1855297 RepID=UPI00090F2AA6|nr:VOC family protein [Mucilaginibacter sp. OK098]SHN07972.1 Glyoxalase superfamily enzyme, possibly 3-demethylubiquinone-9 3-methyltransferase [Mucilaginibacter sp. OK098]
MATTMETSAQRITPFLWFNSNVEEGLNFYTSVFKDSRIGNVSHLDAGGNGKVTVASFILNGVEFMILDGGPAFTFNESISFYVKCETQDEVDYYWEELSKGGVKSQCGWLKDKFGVSWQIVPNAIERLMYDADPAKSKRVMEAMMKMSKMIIADLEKAYNG